MRTLITICIVLSLTASNVLAVFISDFPGLDELIERADAIVVVRIDQGEIPAMRPYGKYRCRVQQTLKGDIVSGEITVLSLMNTRALYSTSDADFGVEFPVGWSNPFPYGSSYLVFLTCGPEPNNQPKYRSIACLGSTIRLSSTDYDNLPTQPSTREHVQALLRRTAELKAEQSDKDQRFLELVIDANQDSSGVERN